MGIVLWRKIAQLPSSKSEPRTVSIGDEGHADFYNRRAVLDKTKPGCQVFSARARVTTFIKTLWSHVTFDNDSKGLKLECKKMLLSNFMNEYRN